MRHFRRGAAPCGHAVFRHHYSDKQKSRSPHIQRCQFRHSRRSVRDHSPFDKEDQGGKGLVKTAFVFPGQGSQNVGMAREFWENFDEVKALYDEASSVLGYDIKELSFNGPQEELNKTFRTQPALLTAGIAAFKVLT